MGVHYDLGEGHALLGRRCPISTWSPNGPPAVFTLLHDAGRCCSTSVSPAVNITPWADRVQLVDAKYLGAWELPDGPVTAPTAC